ncbi:hypothetical protein [Methylocystis sp. JR02]|nr:hypothetical protein [Methylocystis sp. JR02]MDJ0448474.1 hypothetical protein [Methylocystis sp. JR02]
MTGSIIDGDRSMKFLPVLAVKRLRVAWDDLFAELSGYLELEH